MTNHDVWGATEGKLGRYWRMCLLELENFKGPHFKATAHPGLHMSMGGH